MPFTVTGAGSALVTGRRLTEETTMYPQHNRPATIDVVVTRAVQVRGKAAQPGDRFTLPRALALELVASGKAKHAPAEAPAAESPQTKEPKK